MRCRLPGDCGSPQLMSTVGTSPRPASLTVPENQVTPPSSTAVAARLLSSGTALATTMLNAVSAKPPESSVTRTITPWVSGPADGVQRDTPSWPIEGPAGGLVRGNGRATG